MFENDFSSDFSSDLSIVVKDLQAAVEKLIEERGGVPAIAFVCRGDEVWVTSACDDSDDSLSLNESFALALPRLIDLVRQVDADRVILMMEAGLMPILSEKEAMLVPDQNKLLDMGDGRFALAEPKFSVTVVDIGTFGTKMYTCPIERTDEYIGIGELEECTGTDLGFFEPLRGLVQEFGIA